MIEGLNPQQTEFIAYYLDPNSETYANALQSALKAKYSQEYAESITYQMPDWLSESLGQQGRLLLKAEKRLEKTLDGENDQLAHDASKFIAETIGKKKGYSKRTEITGENGKDLTINILKYGENNS